MGNLEKKAFWLRIELLTVQDIALSNMSSEKDVVRVKHHLCERVKKVELRNPARSGSMAH